MYLAGMVIEVFHLCTPPLTLAYAAFIARQPAVAQFDDALAVARVFFRVRHLHNRRALRG